MSLEDRKDGGARRDGGRVTAEEIAVVRTLRGAPLESIWGLLDHCAVVELEPGEALIREGDTGRILYMVLSGALDVRVGRKDGETVARLEAGETVGEISILDGQPASADVIAAAPCRLLAMEEDTFWRLVGVSHEFAVSLLLLLAERMRASNDTLDATIRERRRFEREALTDGLTGLRNRRWLDDVLPRLARRHARDRRPLSVLMIDVDRFKAFNDDHGHDAGDRVLASVARVLSRNLRPTDFVARYGGEEFAVVLPGTDLEGARVAAERVRVVAAQTPVASKDGPALPPVTISAGAAQIAEGEEAADALRRADAALYRAKEGGRNRVEIAPE